LGKIPQIDLQLRSIWCKALEKRKGQTMNDFEWVIEKDGNVIGSKITNPATGVTTARDHHGNTLGY